MVSPFGRWSRPLQGALLLGGLGLAAGLVVASCSKMALTAPSGSSIALIISANTLSVNGSATVTAVVTEGSLAAGTGGNQTVTSGTGSPVQNGTVVTFTTTLGRVDPASAETHDGQAVVQLYGDGRSGTATVTAISGAASKTATVEIGAAAAAKVVVTANPQTVAAIGGTSTIVAQVQDQQGNGLLGVPISFSTTAGTLSATSVLSDNNGNATTVLTTNAAATVTASAGGGGSSGSALSATVNITVKSQTIMTISSPASVTVSVPTQLTIGLSSTAGATAVPIVNGVVVNFGDGTSFNLGQIGSASTTVSHLYAASGQLTASVSGTDQNGQATSSSTPIVVAPLSAVPVANPSTTALGGAIQFTVTVTTGALIDHYIWDFGDGNPPLSTPSNSQSYVYLSRGGHTVTITVVPVAGPSFTVSVPIVIT